MATAELLGTFVIGDSTSEGALLEALGDYPLSKLAFVQMGQDRVTVIYSPS